MLYRKISSYLETYYKTDSNRILCIDGARQIGKSYIIRETAKLYYPNYIEINLADDFNGNRVFENVRTVESFYLQLSIIAGNILDNKSNTIIFLDEIQIYPHLITLLKPLSIDNKYRYICSGSLLGIALKVAPLIPIGYITIKRMYPLDFEEFLIANNVGELAIDYMRDCYNKLLPLDETTHQRILDLFKTYLYVGGLPAAVNEYLDTKNIYKIREVQKDIYDLYVADASKYDEEKRLKVKTVYNYIVSNMENVVKRVMFTKIEDNKNARFEKYENEFEYLINAGVVLGNNAISNPVYPLANSSVKNLIKLFYNDVGLLTYRLYRENINPLLNDALNINLGSVYETVVAEELAAHEHNLFYFDRRKLGEVDFIIDDFNNLCVKPLGIKSGKDYMNYSALPKMLACKDYHIKNALVFHNNRDVLIKDKIIHMPIYYIMFV